MSDLRTTPYKRTGNKISLLDVTRFCSKADTIKTGMHRIGLLSTAFHAELARAPEAKALRLQLTDAERLQLDALARPGSVVFTEQDERIELDPGSAEREVLLGITEHGAYADPLAQDVFLRGKMDFGWVREVRGMRVAYVGDIKFSEWTSSEGTDSLQIMAYGFGYGDKMQCDAFVPAIWAASDGGSWQWGDWIDLSSSRAGDIWSTIRAAGANRDTGFVTGAHCSKCFARLKCPEYLMPITEGALSVLDGEQDMTPETALAALLAAQAYKAAAERAISTVQEAVNRGLRIADPRSSKVYRPIRCKGKRSLDVDSLRSELGDEKIERFMKQGAPYQRFDWGKP